MLQVSWEPVQASEQKRERIQFRLEQDRSGCRVRTARMDTGRTVRRPSGESLAPGMVCRSSQQNLLMWLWERGVKPDLRDLDRAGRKEVPVAERGGAGGAAGGNGNVGLSFCGFLGLGCRPGAGPYTSRGLQEQTGLDVQLYNLRKHEYVARFQSPETE